jgi:hypothetical protein
MQFVALPVAGAGGREVLVNPEQVVCILEAGENRTQIVTTGLSTESSISIVVALSVREVGHRLGATVVHDAAGQMS